LFLVTKYKPATAFGCPRVLTNLASRINESLRVNSYHLELHLVWNGGPR